jgi:hypothetical protein
MTIHVGSGGVNKAVSAVHVGVSGAWKEVNSAWIGVSGAWKQFYTSIRVQFFADTLVHNNPGGTATVGIRVDSDGGVYTREAGGAYTLQYQWLLTGVNTDYEVYATTAGPGVSGSATDTWLGCGSDRAWEFSTSGNDDQTDLNIIFRDAVTTDVLTTDPTFATMIANSAP